MWAARNSIGALSCEPWAHNLERDRASSRVQLRLLLGERESGRLTLVVGDIVNDFPVVTANSAEGRFYSCSKAGRRDPNRGGFSINIGHVKLQPHQRWIKDAPGVGPYANG